MRGLTRRRRALAALALLLWLLGVEVLPNVHLASHGDGTAHDHTPAGMIVTVSFDTAPHAHDDGVVHTHAEPTAEDARAYPPMTSLDVPRHGHTAAGLAHRLLALHEAPPPVLAPIAVDRVATDIVHETRGRATLDVALTSSARGPPNA